MMDKLQSNLHRNMPQAYITHEVYHSEASLLVSRETKKYKIRALNPAHVVIYYLTNHERGGKDG